MKAFLLAGGRGERLRPLTDTMPKCLAPIDRRPLLAYWLELCAREGIHEVLLNVSHHFTAVDTFLRDRPCDGVRVHVVHETEPSGTATTVVRERSFVSDQQNFWVFYADNLSDMQLEPMRARHAGHDDPLTVGLFHTSEPQSAGIVDMDASGRIVDFVEKPERPVTDLANAGVYLARQALFDGLPTGAGNLDFGLHVLPGLVGRMHGYIIQDFHEDIGTPERLTRASSAWATRTRQ